MATQAWHPELDEDDRRRPQRRRQRRSPVMLVLWILVALIVVVGGALGAAWFTGAIPGGRSGAAVAQQPAAGTQVAQATNGGQQQQQANAPQPTVTKREAIGDWVYTCIKPPNSEAERCLILQQLSHPETRAPVFMWRIAQDGNGGFVSEWETPTGIVVGRGIVLEAGTEKPVTIPFQACTQAGCVAVANLAPDFIATLSATQSASATVFPIGGQGVKLNLSVNGLKEALAALQPAAGTAPAAQAQPQ